MALSHEDKKDVAGAMGKAIAKKVQRATIDKLNPTNFKNYRHDKMSKMARAKDKFDRADKDIAAGHYVKLKPTQSHTTENRTHRVAYSPYRPDTTGRSYRKDGLKESPQKYAQAGDKKFRN